MDNNHIAIDLRGLTKAFRTYRKERGILGAFKGLFHRKHVETRAVDVSPFRSPRAISSDFSAQTAPEKPRP